MPSGLDLLNQSPKDDLAKKIQNPDIINQKSGLSLLRMDEPKVENLITKEQPQTPSPELTRQRSEMVKKFQETGNPLITQLIPGMSGTVIPEGIVPNEPEPEPKNPYTQPTLIQGEEPSLFEKMKGEIKNLLPEFLKDEGSKRRLDTAEAVNQVVAAEYLGVNPSDVSPELSSAFKSGYSQSVPGLVKQSLDKEKIIPPPKEAMETWNTAQRLAYGAGGMVGDVPFMLGGALLVSGTGPVGTMAGAFALPQALRAYYSHKLDKGEIENPKEFIDALTQTLIAEAKGAVTGAVTGGVGKLLAPFGNVAKLGSEATTMTAVSSLLEGQVPSKQDFFDNALLMVGFGGLGKVSSVALNMKDIWVKTGMKPENIVEEAKVNIPLAKSIISEESIPEDIINKIKTKVADVEKNQTELAIRLEAEKKKNNPEEVVKEELKIKGEEVDKIKEGIPDYQTEAEKAGVTFNGIQERVKGPGIPLFTDPETGSTFSLKEGQSIEDALKEIRDKYVEKPSEEIPVEEKVTEDIPKSGVELIRSNFERTEPKTEIESLKDKLKNKEISRVEYMKEMKNLKQGTKPIEPIVKTEPQPFTEIEEQTGSPTPQKLETSEHPFRDKDPSHTNTMSQIYEQRIKDPQSQPEVFTRYLINEVNRYLNGEEISIEDVRDTLSSLAGKANELRMSFESPADFNSWRNIVSEAARWARNSEKVKESKDIQLNMMIPVDQIPNIVKDVIRKSKEFIDKFKEVKEFTYNDFYRNKDIFDKTGYWLGRDGMWRYEVSDYVNIWNPKNKIRFNGDILRKNKFAFLGDIYKNDSLYRAIPGIEYIRVKYSPGLNYNGLYKPTTNTIILKYPHDRNTLVHEIQHVVNSLTKSKFVGSSVKSKEIEIIDNFFTSLTNHVKDKKLLRNIEELHVEYSKGLKTISQSINDVTHMTLWTPYESVVQKLIGELINKDPLTEYMKYPGEMEARLTTRRLDMTPKERKEIPPWETLDRMLKEESLTRESGFKLYSGIPIDEATKAIIKGAKDFKNYIEKSREMKSFKPLIAAKKLSEEFTRSFIDRSGNIRDDLLQSLGDEGYKIIQKMYLSKGASSKSANMLKQMNKEVYSGLSGKEKKILDGLILASRMHDISNYKTKFNYPSDISSDGKVPDKAIAYSELFKNLHGISDERAELLQQRTKAYFDWMKKPLKDMLDAELISQTEYDNLINHNYRRLKLVDIYDKRYEAKVGSKRMTVNDSGVESLKKGRDTDIFESSSEVMALEVFNRAYGRIFNNEANKTLYDLAQSDPTNPFVRSKEFTKEKIPEGWNRLFVFKEGQRKAIYVSPEMSKEWIINNPEISYKMGQILRWSSGSAILRTFATGIDWAFALANLPRDMMHLWFASRTFKDGKWEGVYNSVAPIYGLQIGRDLTSVFSDAINRKGRYQKYIDEGGGMEFLVHQGRLLQRGRHIDNTFSKVLDFLGYFGETSEILTRLAIRDRVIRNKSNEQKISFKEANKDKEITKEATFAARDYMDFGQGGGIAKALDNAFPYLNAAIQGTRGLLRTFKPGSGSALSSTFKLAQLAALTTGIYLASKNNNPLTMQDLQGSIDMQNNLCIPLGDNFAFQDDEGQTHYPYIKIPFDNGQRFFKTFFEASADKWLGNEVDVDRVTGALKQFSPVELAPLPPTISGILGYMSNKDFWKNEDIWRKTDQPFSWPNSKEEFTEKTPKGYTEFGQLTGMSPERTKYMVEELITKGSMWSYLTGEAYDKVFGDLPKEDKQTHLAETLSKFPLTKRFIGITNPYSKFASKIEKVKEEAMLQNWAENRSLDERVKKYFDGELERSDIGQYIMTFKDENTRERLKERFKFSEKIKGVANRSFWLSLKGIPDTKARAKVYIDRYNLATDEEKVQLLKEVGQVQRAGGIVSEEFKREVMRLRMND
jgi:hypothetical protein